MTNQRRQVRLVNHQVTNHMGYRVLITKCSGQLVTGVNPGIYRWVDPPVDLLTKQGLPALRPGNWSLRHDGWPEFLTQRSGLYLPLLLAAMQHSGQDWIGIRVDLIERGNEWSPKQRVQLSQELHELWNRRELLTIIDYNQQDPNPFIQQYVPGAPLTVSFVWGELRRLLHQHYELDVRNHPH